MNKHIRSHANKTRGLLFVGLLALASFSLASLSIFSDYGISSLVVCIIVGMITGNILPHSPSLNPGVQFAAKRILRLAIILYGFRVSFQQIASVGLEAALLDVAVVVTTLFVGYFLGRKVFKLDRDISILVSIGSAICGAAAVLACEDILKSEPHKAALAVGTVVLFGTIAMFLYPFLQTTFLHLTDNQYGVYVGASVHEVAQSLVAGSNVNPEAGKIAVIVKMMRVLLLVPALIFISAWVNKGADNKKNSKITIPWFAVLFVVVIGINSLTLFSAETLNLINQADTFLLTMAMGAIGFETKFSKLKKVGPAPLYLALILFAWLMVSTLAMVKLVT